jgi:hypothetical protein
MHLHAFTRQPVAWWFFKLTPIAPVLSHTLPDSCSWPVACALPPAAVAYGFIAGIIGWVIINGSVFGINFVQSYFWPKSDDPTLTRAGTWKIARQMTFHLDGDHEEEEDGSTKLGSEEAGHAAGGHAAEEDMMPPGAAKV